MKKTPWVVVLGLSAWALGVQAAPSSCEIELAPTAFVDAARPGLLQTSIAWGTIRVAGHDTDFVLARAAVTVDRSSVGALAEDRWCERVKLDLVEDVNAMELRIRSEIEGFYGVALEVEVPRGTAVDLEVRRGGDVFIDGIDGEVEVTNRNGSVTLKALGAAAVVHARNGSITADFATVDPELPMSFSTLNGSVDVTFPREVAADLRIRYNRGGVESEFEIESTDGVGRPRADVTGLEGRATRALRGRINGGGPRYYFETANGTIYLRRRAG